MTHVEMIIDYITDGTDFQYSDNHGMLTRCRECKLRDTEYCNMAHGFMGMKDDDYCSYAERREVGDGNTD